MHYDDRVSVEPGSPIRGGEIKVEYRGLLAQSGADSVWMHCGFDGWNKAHDIQMNRTTPNSFSCTTKIQGNREINFCFKDSANHWDNNNGLNWSVPLR